MATREEIECRLTEVNGDLKDNVSRAPGMIDMLCDASKLLMPWTAEWAEEQRARSHSEINELSKESSKFDEFCNEQCAVIREADSMAKAAEFFKDIDFDSLLSALSEEKIISDAQGWVSANRELYRSKIEGSKKTVINLQSALNDLISSLEDINRELDSFHTALIINLCSLAFAIIGIIQAIVGALAAASTGVGIPVAIVVIILAIASLGTAVVAITTMPDVSGEVILQKERIVKAAERVLGDKWPSPPNLSVGSW